MIVKRWFTKTPEGDILDGPFKTIQRAQKERSKHFKRFKYKPVIASEMVDVIPSKHILGDFEDYGY